MTTGEGPGSGGDAMVSGTGVTKAAVSGSLGNARAQDADVVGFQKGNAEQGAGDVDAHPPAQIGGLAGAIGAAQQNIGVVVVHVVAAVVVAVDHESVVGGIHAADEAVHGVAALSLVGIRRVVRMSSRGRFRLGPVVGVVVGNGVVVRMDGRQGGGQGKAQGGKGHAEQHTVHGSLLAGQKRRAKGQGRRPAPVSVMISSG